MMSLGKNPVATLMTVIFLITGFLDRAGASGTVIGNGGDPLYYFLEATRSKIAQTINLINNPKSDVRDHLCSLPELTLDQIAYCRKFILHISDQILTLNQGLQPTVFTLLSGPLLVPGANGQPEEVSARTISGPSGPIEFDRNKLNALPPTDVFFLMVHEFGHKVSFDGKYLTDDQALPPFAYGRRLLDSVAKALLKIAIDKGMVGQQFGLTDEFECLSTVAGHPDPLGSIVGSFRQFTNSNKLAYESDLLGKLYFPERDSKVFFRMQIVEPANCSSDPLAVQSRSTRLSMIRTYTDSSKNPDDLIAEKDYPGLNPICDNTKNWFTIDGQGKSFACRYANTRGDAKVMDMHFFKRNFLSISNLDD